MTAMPHPKAMTIHPAFCALECDSRTAATTPLPNRIRIAVPITSAPKMLTVLLRSSEPVLARTYSGPPKHVKRWRGSSRGGRNPAHFCAARETRRGLALVLELRADPVHDAVAVLAVARPDGLPEADLDAVAAGEEPVDALGPVAPRRHRVVGAGDVHRDDRDVVLLGQERRARAQALEPPVPRARALGVEQQIPALLDE